MIELFVLSSEIDKSLFQPHLSTIGELYSKREGGLFRQYKPIWKQCSSLLSTLSPVWQAHFVKESWGRLEKTIASIFEEATVHLLLQWQIYDLRNYCSIVSIRKQFPFVDQCTCVNWLKKSQCHSHVRTFNL